jgi:hypothetical protein
VIQKQCEEESYFKTKTFIVKMPSVSDEYTKLLNSDAEQKISIEALYSEKSDMYLNEICNNFGDILDVAELHFPSLSESNLHKPFEIECTKVHVIFTKHRAQLKKLVSNLKKSNPSNPS